MDFVDQANGILHFFVLMGLGCVFLRLTKAHRETLHFQTRLFLWAMTIRYITSTALYTGGLVKIIMDEDASGWIVGSAYRDGWESEGYTALDGPWLFLQAYGYTNKGYFYLLAVIFFLTGLPGRMPAAGLNCLFGALTVVIAYRLARSLFSEVVARRAGWMACLFPSLIIWSAQTLKEPVVIFLESIALYGCIQLRVSGFTPRHVILTALGIILLYTFRFYAAYLAVAAIMVGLVSPRSQTGETSMGSAFIMSFLVAGFLLVTGTRATKELEEQRFDIDHVMAMKEGGTIDQKSGVKVEANLRSSSGMSYAVLIGALYLLMAPFPWHWGGSLRMFMVVPEVVIWWGVLFYGVIPGLIYCIRRRLFDVMPILLFLAGMGFLYSLLFCNIGLVYRQRAQLLPWLVIFGSVGIQLHKVGGTQQSNVRRYAA